MIKILQIRETPLTKCDGVDANCQALIELFMGDEEIGMLPTTNYTRHVVPILHQYYLDADEICRSIEDNKPDVIHIHGAYSFTLIVAVRCARKYRLPIVFSPHFHPFYSLRRPFMGRIFFHVITKNILKYVHTLFTINDEDTRMFCNYHSRVTRIPHWSKFASPIEKPIKKGNMILFVGRLNESNKGIEHLYHLPEGVYDIHCVGKGDITLRSDMTKHTNVSDKELSSLYQQASLLIVPSRYEAFSYVSLEALANYTPVLMSDRVRIADYLQDINGVDVFRYQDYGDFVAKVKCVIGRDVDIDSIAAIFSPARISQVYRDAYLSAAQISDN